MRVAVAIDASSLVLVDAATDRPQFTAVAVAAAVFVGQRLDATLVALVRDIRVTLAAGDVRMCRRGVLDVIVTGETILQGLSTGECCNEEKSETKQQFRAHDPGRGHIHCPESLCEWH